MADTAPAATTPAPAAPPTPAAASSSPQLIPSQAVTQRNNPSSRGGSRRRGRGGKKKSDKPTGLTEPSKADQTANVSGPGLNSEAKEFVPSAGPGGGGDDAKPKARNKSGRNRSRRKKHSPNQQQPQLSAPSAGSAADDEGPRPPGGDTHAAHQKPKSRRRRNKDPNRKRYPWRKHIPPHTVDPISLDPLVALPYPPFALVSTAPYVPVQEWPVPEQGPGRELKKRGGAEAKESTTEEERQRRIIEEQWGQKATERAQVDEQNDEAANGDVEGPGPDGKRYYHLFDGRVLAFYLVSQLQFIDPLNRRDSTRDELVNLDAYLAKHRLGKAGVVEAYDSHGVTVSAAGVAGQSSEGRALILQQEAQALLGSLFGGRGGGVGVGAPQQEQERGRRVRASRRVIARASSTEGTDYDGDVSSRNELAQRHRNQPPVPPTPRTDTSTEHDAGIYVHDQGGMVMIDDDENPGLRGGYLATRPRESTSSGDDGTGAAPPTMWSASHITGRYGHVARVREANFPALPNASEDAAPSSSSVAGANEAPAAGGAKPSRSLQRISKVVAKTDPAEVERQRIAREEAQRRAMMSNLSFVDPSTSNAVSGMPSVALAGHAVSSVSTEVSEGQLERNRNLASALGVAPSTVRSTFNSGWARPTVAQVSFDEFGNELNAAQYPDSLLEEAQERMGEVLKLERRWKAFLADDTAASHPLRPMDRPLRKFVHEYSDFWKLHTESFDPEPNRYIHCVKLRDTSVPHPLLSEAASNWRGPGTYRPMAVSVSELPRGPAGTTVPLGTGPSPSHQQQAAGQSTVSRDFPPPKERVPLQLAPRTVPPGMAPPPGAMFDLTEAAAALPPTPAGQTSSAPQEAQPSSRFSSLVEGRERAPLNLAPRTIPLELPPYQAAAKGSATIEARAKLREAQLAERARKQREEEAKRNIIAEAFASSDEEEGSSSRGGGSRGDYADDDSDGSSDWGVEDAVYSGSDEEE